MSQIRRRSLIFSGLCVATFSASAWLRPSVRASETLRPIKLETQIPEAFDGWLIDKTIVPVLPDPSVQAKIDKIYNQTLARTYIDRQGVRVMLSIAYGADQGSDGTSAHRPEFCYSAQGFVVQRLGGENAAFGGRKVDYRRVIGRMGNRIEPITYWFTLNEHVVEPGFDRKLNQIKLGLTGQIPDGMIVRVSTIGSDLNLGFANQRRFLDALANALEPSLRSRYFGSAGA